MTNRFKRIAFPLLAIAAALVLASTLSEVLSPVLFAVLIAVILNPAVEAAGRLGLPRVVTVTILYLAITILLVIAGVVLTKQLGDLAQSLRGEHFLGDLNGNGLIDLEGEQGPEFDDRNGNGVYDGGALLQLEGWINAELTRRAGGVLGTAFQQLRSATLETLGGLARPASDVVSQIFEYAASWAGGVIHLATLLVLVPFYLFFFLVEYPAMSRRLRGLVPPRYREQVNRITHDIGRELVTFLRGRLLCGAVKGLFLWAGLVFLGVNFAMSIAFVTGLLSLIPILGFLAGLIPASILAITMPGGGPETLLWVVGLFCVGEAVEGLVLFPLILGKETGLHPVMIVVVLLAGGALMGTLGVIVAIPLALILKVLWRELGLPLYKAWAYPPEGQRPT